MENQWNGRSCSITFDGTTYRISGRGVDRTVTPVDGTELAVKRLWLRRYLCQGETRLVRLSGLPKSEVKKIVLAFEISRVVRWADEFTGTINSALKDQRWIPRERVLALAERQPSRTIIDKLKRAKIESHLSGEDRCAMDTLMENVASYVEEINERIVQLELVSRKAFFDQIERQPLSLEQSRAVISFDNRVQLVAAAGSGKTSVMVARAAYAIARGFVAPERILLLAFNKEAANELKQRVQARLNSAGVDSTGIRVNTFHAFGLDAIGKGTGARPRFAPWLDSGKDSAAMSEIVDHLRDTSPDFRYNWDLFRLLFSSIATTPDGGDYDFYDTDQMVTGYSTFDGKHVKSHGERLIANWLFLNGVNYEYERPYVHPTATPDHSQYLPDFYYPDADVWHEHWALDRDGKPPESFEGYLEDLQWKLDLHRSKGTHLIESTWAGIVHGTGLGDLDNDLKSHGIMTDWNPDRPLTAGQEVRHEELCRRVRTFMSHIKSSRLDEAGVAQRLKSTHRHLAGARTNLFLGIYWPIHEEWNRRLRADNHVDFEDMLSLAADAIENGSYDAPYDLILVDELQDASQARARLIKGLLDKPGRYLLAVGDDWQSINRFAGADISVMTEFSKWFGEGPRLKLTKTFRCTQKICDVSSEFISKNPLQIPKEVRSSHSEPGLPIQIIHCENSAEALDTFLKRLSEDVASGKVMPAGGERVTVDVLGRYKFDKKVMPQELPNNLVVAFRTVHSSKGLEADYIVIPNAAAGIYGFPSAIADDPVMDLVMASKDTYEHAEERRLFYVALTRARRQVAILAQPGAVSPFVIELSKSLDMQSVDVEGNPTKELQTCLACGKGTLVQRTGRYGDFLGCSQFPKCKGKPPQSKPGLKGVTLSAPREVRRTRRTSPD